MSKLVFGEWKKNFETPVGKKFEGFMERGKNRIFQKKILILLVWIQQKQTVLFAEKKDSLAQNRLWPSCVFTNHRCFRSGGRNWQKKPIFRQKKYNNVIFSIPGGVGRDLRGFEGIWVYGDKSVDLGSLDPPPLGWVKWSTQPGVNRQGSTVNHRPTYLEFDFQADCILCWGIAQKPEIRYDEGGLGRGGTQGGENIDIGWSQKKTGHWQTSQGFPSWNKAKTWEPETGISWDTGGGGVWGREGGMIRLKISNMIPIFHGVATHLLAPLHTQRAPKLCHPPPPLLYLPLRSQNRGRGGPVGGEQ